MFNSCGYTFKKIELKNEKKYGLEIIEKMKNRINMKKVLFLKLGTKEKHTKNMRIKF